MPSKGLEAFNRIVQAWCSGKNSYNYDDEVEVRLALNHLEQLEKEDKKLREANDKLSNSVIGIDFNAKGLIEKIEELEQQLAYECGCNSQLVDYHKRLLGF